MGKQHSSPELERLKEASPYTFKAPIIFIICCDMEKCWKHPNEKHLSSETDAAIVATQMILAAFENGIGSTWVRFLDRAKLAEILTLPANIKPMVFLSMGYPAAGSHPSKLHFNKKEFMTFLEACISPSGVIAIGWSTIVICSVCIGIFQVIPRGKN